MRQMLKNLGEDLSAEQLRQVMSFVDADHDGKISFADFSKIMK